MQNDGGGGSGIVASETIVLDSETNWGLIILIFIWWIAFAMLAIMIFSCGKSTGRRTITASSRVAGSNEDEENQDTKQEMVEPSTAVAEPVHDHQVLGRAPMGILPIMAATIGLALSVVAQSSCRYINADEIRLPNNHEIDYFGLWSAAIYDGISGSDDVCRSTYRDEEEFPVDTPIKVARYAAVLASVLGSITLLCVIYFAMSKRLDSVWFGRLSWPFFVAAIAQGLVLIVVSTDLCEHTSSACSLDLGGVASITASVYWIVAAIGVTCTSVLVSV
jgi:hypothetical protein